MKTLDNLSIYGREFNDSCVNWMKDAKYNLIYLRVMQCSYNEILRKRGYVFLRDIYEKLGIPVTKESIVVGWRYDTNDMSIDNYIDFGLDEHDDMDEPNIMLDFNVDGIIYDKI